MTEDEFRSGVFADSRAVAAQVKEGLGGFDFVEEALVTLSPQYHGVMISRDNFDAALTASIAALQALDKVKKTLFYGRDNGLSELGKVHCRDLPNRITDGSDLTHAQAIDYIHAALGVATEAGELLEGLHAAINGQGVDIVNTKEESGDVKWYLAILSRVAGWAWGSDERSVIGKLRLRFPNAFTEFDANHRNLVGERAVLETHLPASERMRKMPGERNNDGNAIEAQMPK